MMRQWGKRFLTTRETKIKEKGDQRCFLGRSQDKALYSEAYPWTVTGETMYLNDIKSMYDHQVQLSKCLPVTRPQPMGRE